MKKVIISTLIVFLATLLVSLFLVNPIMCPDRKDFRAKSDLSALKKATEMYAVDFGYYPNDLKSLTTTVSPNRKESIENQEPNTYLRKIPLDPWGVHYNYYKYEVSYIGIIIDIWSYGADGLPGGEKLDSDLHVYIQHNKALKNDAEETGAF